MPSFATPGPITLDVDIAAGSVLIAASDRDDTVVEVQPADPDNTKDVTTAEGTSVDFAAGRLTIKTPRSRGIFGKTGTVDVVVRLPTRSQVVANGGLADFRAEGTLGECRLKTSAGHIRLQDTAALKASTSHGDVAVELVAGRAELTTGSGELRVDRLDGSGTVKNSNGATRIGEVTGDLKVGAANGDIFVGHAGGDVHAKTANGRIRVDEVVRGSVVMETSAGELAVGIREGTAAWLDVRAIAGRVRNELTSADAPGEAEERVEVRARTSLGDIVIHRA
ncbi:hypothetical protein ADK67_26705 [Saccharothrix sp. NRRL B-16348]|uniref:DUF4097 family beta strand repeat-containing protein n=1 Tax=Saccharothrix sp. NRRL B-16348 TaxID=1415542 RepID=UPI0006AF594D|nr:DUF4097 family beta strand repeat-containing protein [Saccharothrix sp. NRRL B-16348]KOX21332.1 hypothetical protein ADK67_26705 [Saccharothrix sp. NRRL B-16348]